MRFNPFKKTPTTTFSEPDQTTDNVFKALTSDQLKVKFADEITAIYRTSGIAQTEFEAYFLPTLLNYLYFVQAIPATSYAEYDRLNGLAELALAGAKNGIKIRNGMVLPTGVRADLIDKQKSRWSYLVLCSILLNALRDNLNHCMVEAGDKTKFYSWDFSQGALGDFPSFRFRKIAFDNEVMDASVASFLMMRFIDDNAVTWIAEHPAVFTEFMGIINGHAQHCLNLSMFLKLDKVLPNIHKVDTGISVVDELATAPKVKGKKKKKKKKSKNRRGDFNSHFFQWLFNALENGEVTLNTNHSKCHVVDGGLFVERDPIVKQYAESTDSATEEEEEKVAGEQLAQYEAVCYTAYGRELVGHLMMPPVEFLSYTPVNEDLVLIGKSDDE